MTLTNQLVASNATTIQNQADYDEKFNKISSSYSSAYDELKVLQKEIEEKNIRKIKITQFLNILKSQDEILAEFSPNLFTSLVDRIEVDSKNDIKVNYKNIEGKDS